MVISQEDAIALKHERDQLTSDFGTFKEFRQVEGTWNMIRRATLAPDLPPELRRYAEGAVFMAEKLDDAIRTLILIKSNNPTRFDAVIYGSGETQRHLESNWKLIMANTWDSNHNVMRWLDDYVYESQTTFGIAAPQIHFKKKVYTEENGRPISNWPMSITKTLIDGFEFKGDYLNPSVAFYSYSLSAIDCDVKNQKGERPSYGVGYDKDNLGWVGEDLPEDFYTANANKKIQIIVRDGETNADCPLEGCNHKQRRITVYICKDGGTEKDYDELESYDSPFTRCSFVIVPGDIRHNERDPHRIFKPSAWVLYGIIQKYNTWMQMLLAMLRQQLSNDSKVINAGGTNPDTFAAIQGAEDAGQAETVKLPETGSREIPITPGAIQSIGNPSIDGLLRMLDETKRDWDEHKPNPALVGQMAVSEVAASAAVIQVEGAGITIGGDLKNWDGQIVRFYEEARHAILFNSYFEPDDAKTKYVIGVGGTDNVMGYRDAKIGDQIYMDEARAKREVKFVARTSKETPSEATNRKMTAITGFNEGILTRQQRAEAWDIFDYPMQEKELFREEVRKFLMPMKLRRVAKRVVSTSAAKTGVDMGEEPMVDALPVPEDNGSQTHNTVAANNERMHQNPVQAPVTGNPTGGSSGLI